MANRYSDSSSFLARRSLTLFVALALLVPQTLLADKATSSSGVSRVAQICLTVLEGASMVFMSRRLKPLVQSIGKLSQDDLLFSDRMTPRTRLRLAALLGRYGLLQNRTQVGENGEALSPEAARDVNLRAAIMELRLLLLREGELFLEQQAENRLEVVRTMGKDHWSTFAPTYWGEVEVKRNDGTKVKELKELQHPFPYDDSMISEAKRQEIEAAFVQQHMENDLAILREAFGVVDPDEN